MWGVTGPRRRLHSRGFPTHGIFARGFFLGGGIAPLRLPPHLSPSPPRRPSRFPTHFWGVCGWVPTLESGSVVKEGRSCEVLAACRGHEVGAAFRTEPPGKKKCEIPRNYRWRLHPESEHGEGARALKTALGWSKDALQAPLFHLVLLNLFFFPYFFFFFK